MKTILKIYLDNLTKYKTNQKNFTIPTEVLPEEINEIKELYPEWDVRIDNSNTCKIMHKKEGDLIQFMT